MRFISKLLSKFINKIKPKCTHDFEIKEKMFVASRRCRKCGGVEFCIIAPTLFGKNFDEVHINQLAISKDGTTPIYDQMIKERDEFIEEWKR